MPLAALAGYRPAAFVAPTSLGRTTLVRLGGAGGRLGTLTPLGQPAHEAGPARLGLLDHRWRGIDWRRLDLGPWRLGPRSARLVAPATVGFVEMRTGGVAGVPPSARRADAWARARAARTPAPRPASDAGPPSAPAPRGSGCHPSSSSRRSRHSPLPAAARGIRSGAPAEPRRWWSGRRARRPDRNRPVQAPRRSPPRPPTRAGEAGNEKPCRHCRRRPGSQQGLATAAYSCDAPAQLGRLSRAWRPMPRRCPSTWHSRT